MVNYACAFGQSELGKYFERIIVIIIIIITVNINYFIIMATICYKKAQGTIDFSLEFCNLGWFSIYFVS